MAGLAGGLAGTVAAGLATVWAVGCGAEDKPPPALTSVPVDAGPGGLLPPDASASFGGETCSAETKLVYVVSAERNLYRFDPQAVTFTLVGMLSCPDTAGMPYSMAVGRTGIAWVVYDDGQLFQVDTKNAACRGTSYVGGQSEFVVFGMGFSSNSAGGADETLFVAQGDPSASSHGLAVLDTTSLQLRVVGDFDLLPNGNAELTGTGDGRLFGAFEGQPFVVAEIAKANGHILSQAPQAGVSSPGTGASNFAFAFWGGDFWLFVGPGGPTDVFQYQPATGTTTKRSTVSFEIVGAGVSTCAPVTPPK